MKYAGPMNLQTSGRSSIVSERRYLIYTDRWYHKGILLNPTILIIHLNPLSDLNSVNVIFIVHFYVLRIASYLLFIIIVNLL